MNEIFFEAPFLREKQENKDGLEFGISGFRLWGIFVFLAVSYNQGCESHRVPEFFFF